MAMFHALNNSNGPPSNDDIMLMYMLARENAERIYINIILKTYDTLSTIVVQKKRSSQILREAGGLRDKDMISSSIIQNVAKFPNSQVSLA
ncbi:hypothetical protein H5410_026731 [Solanum commersonii]|uniref:Uncharacterized protein n=1 Tax=Solanum commersonii TaxID=4109 RepID=A0A9J5YZW3_SOLCO|nr:hypothetical protein H5410_026731 [Solanum commersonii]